MSNQQITTLAKHMMKNKTNNLIKFKLNQQLPQAKHGQRATAETKKKPSQKHKQMRIIKREKHTIK